MSHDYNMHGHVRISRIETVPDKELPRIDTTVKTDFVDKIVAYSAHDIDVYPTDEFANKHGLKVGDRITIMANNDDDSFLLRWMTSENETKDADLNADEMVAIFGSYDGAFKNPGLVLGYFSKV
ncbi:hypothetical protein HGG76_27485 [Ochrobactrum tritici]|uniref:Uncharacterized protein n=1 Tax=Brucella tritici TaxID=94626 RepID=A0A7X6JBW6_9HYPH|nr:hypothetical protein [Brucella tritici]